MIKLFLAFLVFSLSTGTFATVKKGHQVRLSKAQLVKLLETGDYALLSAGRNLNHPADRTLSNDDIDKRAKKLQIDLVRSKLLYQKVLGKYGVSEESYLVLSSIKNESQLLGLGAKYNQESIILGSKGLQKMVYTTGNDLGFGYYGRSYSEIGPDQTDYYTEVITGEGLKFRFSLNFNFELKCPNQIYIFEACTQIAI